MGNKPKYWDSVKGQVLRAIIFDGATKWEEVRKKSNLSHKQLYKVVGELKHAGVIDYSETGKDKRFLIIDTDLEIDYLSVDEIYISELKTAPQDHIEDETKPA